MSHRLGESFEKKTSLDFFSDKVPILVDCSLLRKRNLGQVDLCGWKWNSKTIIVAECKLGTSRVNRIQYQRLKGSLEFIASTLNSQGKIEVIQEFAKS